MLVAAGCGESEPLGTPTAIATGSPAIADQSLSTAEYVAQGLPSPDQPWSGEDMAQAGKVLADVAAKGPEHLPRHQSRRSGEVFDRMTSQENLTSLFGESVPIDRRIAMADGHVQGAAQILGLYRDAYGKQLVGGSELVEVTGTDLRSTSTMLGLVGPYLASLDADNPAYQARLKSRDEMKSRLAKAADDAVTMVGQHDRFSPDEITRLVSAMRDGLPHVVAVCAPEVREETLTRLAELPADPALIDLQYQLEELGKDVRAAIVRADAEAKLPENSHDHRQHHYGRAAEAGR